MVRSSVQVRTGLPFLHCESLKRQTCPRAEALGLGLMNGGAENDSNLLICIGIVPPDGRATFSHEPRSFFDPFVRSSFSIHLSLL
jgi:hypothetical protein